MKIELNDDYVRRACKPGTTECCRYLTAGPAGWSCEKHTGLRLLIDRRVAEGTFRATGDNCPGVDQ